MLSSPAIAYFSSGFNADRICQRVLPESGFKPEVSQYFFCSFIVGFLGSFVFSYIDLGQSYFIPLSYLIVEIQYATSSDLHQIEILQNGSLMLYLTVYATMTFLILNPVHQTILAILFSFVLSALYKKMFHYARFL